MKRSNCIAALGVAIVPVLGMAAAESSTVFDGGWRLSIGAVYDSGVKTDMRFSPRQTYVSPFSRSAGALSRKRAQENGNGTTVGTRTHFVDKNGNRSWIDTYDPASGYDAGLTHSYSFSKGAYNDDGSFMLGEAAFEEMNMVQTAFAAMESFDNWDEAMPGISIQFSRNLYHNDEYRWGIEAAFGFQYARRNNVFKSNSAWKIGSSSKTEGSYSSFYRGGRDTLLSELLSGGLDWLWHDGQYGTCVGQTSESTDHFAIPVDAGDIDRRWSESTRYDVSYGSLDAHGDYDNMELMLLLQPYYDLCDWFSVNATFGMVVSRQSMEMSFSLLRDGLTEYRSCNDFSQWDVYGIAGLGAMLYYRGFTLSGDFLARFLDRDMDISDSHYSGTVSRGNWMFRLAVGYEF